MNIRFGFVANSRVLIALINVIAIDVTYVLVPLVTCVAAIKCRITLFMLRSQLTSLRSFVTSNAYDN